MTDSHKKALARGRAEGASVRAYLEAIENSRPRRGRPVNTESIQRQLANIDKKLETAEALSKLQLLQQQVDLEAQLASLGESVDLSGLEAAFIEVAKSYGERKGISYQTWRRIGVSAAVLRSAGISRSDKQAAK